MSKQSLIISAATLTLLMALVVSKPFGQLGIDGKQANAQTTTVQQDTGTRSSSGSFEYARLSYTNQKITWDLGNTNVIPNPVSLAQAISFQGGRSMRATFSNLLYLIGQQGWELITIENGVWIFKRGG